LVPDRCTCDVTFDKVDLGRRTTDSVIRVKHCSGLRLRNRSFQWSRKPYQPVLTVIGC
jgi:hypothetical protein